MLPGTRFIRRLSHTGAVAGSHCGSSQLSDASVFKTTNTPNSASGASVSAMPAMPTINVRWTTATRLMPVRGQFHLPKGPLAQVRQLDHEVDREKREDQSAPDGHRAPVDPHDRCVAVLVSNKRITAREDGVRTAERSGQEGEAGGERPCLGLASRRGLDTENVRARIPPLMNADPPHANRQIQDGLGPVDDQGGRARPAADEPAQCRDRDRGEQRGHMRDGRCGRRISLVGMPSSPRRQDDFGWRILVAPW